jgi:hypothetical protein
MKYLRDSGIKKFEELEWGRFWDPETFDFLQDTFVDFLHPIDMGKKAVSRNVKSGTNMMVFYEIEIPFSDNNLSSLNSLIMDIDDCINRIKIELPDMSYNVKLLKDNIKLTIWNR